MDVIYVAQLQDGQVVGVSQLKRDGFVRNTNLIVVEMYDESLLGKLYDREKKQFVDVKN